jgi:Zn-dependent peptidase ImmA (M78 family)
MAFFITEEPLPPEVVLWRERPQTGSAEIEAEFLRLCGQYHNLEVWCGERARSRLPEARGELDEFDYGQAEELAQRVRGELQLGDRPGQELLRVLQEVCGVKVFHRSFDSSGPAASTKSQTFGYAVLLNSQNVRWRRHFDLAHELFHLVTWDVFRTSVESSSCVAGDQEEKLASCFARNLLMPSGVLRIAVRGRMKNGRVPFEALFDIAREFDVSVQALLWQMHYLFGRTSRESDKTEQEIKRAEQLAPFYEEREHTEPPLWPARYRALAVTALRRGEISIGRFAEYLNISRREAASYIEQETEDAEDIDLTPA